MIIVKLSPMDSNKISSHLFIIMYAFNEIIVN